MVDVETLKEAIARSDEIASDGEGGGFYVPDVEIFLAAAREHVACLEGPTDEEVEIAWRSLNATGAFASRNAVRAALVAVVEARRHDARR